MEKKIINVHEYTILEQKEFADLSGDFNPLHLDPIKARRGYLGAVVVHGVHTVFRGLDAYAKILVANELEKLKLQKLTVSFLNPAYLNQKIETHLVNNKDGNVKLQIKHSEQLLSEVAFQWTQTTDPLPAALATHPHNNQESATIEFSPENTASYQGTIDLYINSNHFAAKFPNLVNTMSLHTLAEILSVTRLVGTRCPGSRSIFLSFDLRFHLSADNPSHISYKVAKFDPRFSRVKITIDSTSTSGSLETLYCPLPKQQQNIADIQKVVHQNEFKNQYALIVGASRGLGEVTAKIIAAGGGFPIITYNQGLEDAQRIADEIKAIGGPCKILQCDIASPENAFKKLAKSDYTPTHLYYFATPKILRSKKYNTELFGIFTTFYVDGLLKIYNTYRLFWPDKLSIFYPSSVILDQKETNFKEYSDAKTKGEALCTQLTNSDPNLSILIKRLPRIATDQTLSPIPIPALNALTPMLEVVRELNDI